MTVNQTDLKNPNEKLAEAFEGVIATFNNSTGMQRLLKSDLDLRHYAALMRETYFYTRESPQIQAAATAFFRGGQRDVVKDFLRHAISEIGHDQLALDDMAAAGFDNASIKEGRALPSTIAVTAFAYYQIYSMSPVGYLGYLYFLEFMPVNFGPEYIAAFKKTGVPDEATRFLQDHSVIDVGHTQAMTGYVDGLVRDQHDLDTVIYAMQVTGALYANFVSGAFDSADREVQFPADLAEQHPKMRVVA